ncbi:MAG: BrnA antitoxin family protein [Pseudomonadota bacterium]
MIGENTMKGSLDDLEHPTTEKLEEAPEGPALGAEFWANAKIRPPRAKTSIHLRVDADVLEYFKLQGPGHLTRMNSVLRAYVDAARTADEQ